MILWSWISPLGFGVSCGMDGYLCFILASYWTGSCLWGFMLVVLLGVCQTNLMSGLMGAWFRRRSLVLRRRDFFLLVFPVNFGLLLGGAIWMMSWEGTRTLGLAVVTVLFLVRYRLFRWLSSGGSFLRFRRRHFGRLLDGNVGSRPPELVKDGDLILLIGRMLRLGGLDTVRG